MPKVERDFSDVNFIVNFERCTKAKGGPHSISLLYYFLTQKLSCLCALLIKHHAMKAHGGVEV
jgi:hypothetical protein